MNQSCSSVSPSYLFPVSAGEDAVPCADEIREQKGEVGAGEDDVFESPDPEEAQPTREQKSPDMPSASDVSEHKVTHCPYRSWCDECVEAFGRERQHHSSDGKTRRIPRIHSDYLFLTPKGLKKREELDPDEIEASQTVIVAYCSVTKFLFAHAVPHKGLGDDNFAADIIAQDRVAWPCSRHLAQRQ